MKSIHIPPAQLWIGSANQLKEQTKKYAQSLFCNQGGCSTCITCQQIRLEQHHAFLWLTTKNQYTLEDLSPIFRTIKFALEARQHFFFILQESHHLSAICANSLLKPLEEPPSGYHFILHAAYKDRILPTIQSRCIITEFKTTACSSIDAEIIPYFTTIKDFDPISFGSLLDRLKPNERHSLELITLLLDYWNKKYSACVKNGQLEKEQFAQYMIDLLTHAIKKPPMPGSGKIFWKNLYLKMFTPAH